MRILIPYLLFLIFILPAASLAQNIILEDVIYLKDGGIWRGKIIEQADGQYYKIRIAGGSEIVVLAENIESITQENRLPTEYFVNTTRYYNVTSIGILIGESTYSDIPAGPSFEMINGYKWNPRLCTGILLGLEYLNEGLLQTGLDFRWDVIEGKITPFVYANAGLNIPLVADVNYSYMQTTTEVGYMLGSGLGMHILPRQGVLGFMWSIGYKVITFSQINTYDDDTKETLNYTFNKINVRIGFMF